jgi:hypothetical protein
MQMPMLRTVRPARDARMWLLALAVLLMNMTMVHALTPDRVAGQVPLTDVMTLANPYPNLVLEIRLQLVAANTTRDKVLCRGNLVAGAGPALLATSVGPYVCKVGQRTLTLSTTPVFYDARGYKLKPSAPDFANKAVRVQESKLKWQWK